MRSTLLSKNGEHTILTTPEACGVNITETMKKIGVNLEWPPRSVTYQVAIAGQTVSEIQEEKQLLIFDLL